MMRLSEGPLYCESRQSTAERKGQRGKNKNRQGLKFIRISHVPSESRALFEVQREYVFIGQCMPLASRATRKPLKDTDYCSPELLFFLSFCSLASFVSGSL